MSAKHIIPPLGPIAVGICAVLLRFGTCQVASGKSAKIRILPCSPPTLEPAYVWINPSPALQIADLNVWHSGCFGYVWHSGCFGYVWHSGRFSYVWHSGRFSYICLQHLWQVDGVQGRPRFIRVTSFQLARLRGLLFHTPMAVGEEPLPHRPVRLTASFWFRLLLCVLLCSLGRCCSCCCYCCPSMLYFFCPLSNRNGDIDSWWSSPAAKLETLWADFPWFSTQRIQGKIDKSSYHVKPTVQKPKSLLTSALSLARASSPTVHCQWIDVDTPGRCQKCLGHVMSCWGHIRM